MRTKAQDGCFCSFALAPYGVSDAWPVSAHAPAHDSPVQIAMELPDPPIRWVAREKLLREQRREPMDSTGDTGEVLSEAVGALERVLCSFSQAHVGRAPHTAPRNLLRDRRRLLRGLRRLWVLHRRGIEGNAYGCSVLCLRAFLKTMPLKNASELPPRKTMLVDSGPSHSSLSVRHTSPRYVTLARLSSTASRLTTHARRCWRRDKNTPSV